MFRPTDPPQQRQHFSSAAALQIQKLQLHQELAKAEAATLTPAPGEVLSNHEI